MSNPNELRRIPPCPEYDIETMESWLSYMAGQGWHLKKHGTYRVWYVFEKGEPQQVHYRLLGDHKGPTARGYLWDAVHAGALPDEEEQAFLSDFGWEYVSEKNHFFVYRSTMAHPPEPETDTQLQARAVQIVRRWRILYFVICVLIPAGYFLAPLKDMSLHELVTGHPVFTGAIFLYTLAVLIYGAIAYVQQARLIRRLTTGERLDHRKPFREGQGRAYQAFVVAIVVLYVLFGVTMRSSGSTWIGFLS